MIEKKIKGEIEKDNASELTGFDKTPDIYVVFNEYNGIIGVRSLKENAGWLAEEAKEKKLAESIRIERYQHSSQWMIDNILEALKWADENSRPFSWEDVAMLIRNNMPEHIDDYNKRKDANADEAERK